MFFEAENYEVILLLFLVKENGHYRFMYTLRLTLGLSFMSLSPSYMGK